MGGDRWCCGGRWLLGHTMLAVVGLSFVLKFFLFGSV